jgi:ubiquinone/menaquinone biosynthesis C-methylase UbiE
LDPVNRECPACLYSGAFYLYTMKDNFSKQAAVYAKYRPQYPQELFDFILQQVKERKAAWDCGTGNGQAAKELAQYFEKVYATDISQKQLDEAIPADNVYYSLYPAECTNLSDNSIDLVTVSQALHWFNFEKFYREVKRVAKQDSCIAVWMYSLLRISKEIDPVIEDYHFGTLQQYWDAERKYVDDNYADIPFPFEELKTAAFAIEYYWTLADLEGYLNTWSALQKFIGVNKYNPVPELIEKIKPHWLAGQMKIVFPVHLQTGLIRK